MTFMKDTEGNWEKFAAWLNGEMQGQFASGRALAKKAGIGHSVVARMLNGSGPFDAKSIYAVADALHVPREVAQQAAGFYEPIEDVPLRLQALVRRTAVLPELLQAAVIDVFEAAVLGAERQMQSR